MITRVLKNAYAAGQMKARAKMFLVILCVTTGTIGFWGSWTVADMLMHHDASLEAERWSRYLRNRTEDASLIVRGLPPSESIITALDHANEFGEVVEVAFYKTDGDLAYYKNLSKAEAGLHTQEQEETGEGGVGDHSNLFARFRGLGSTPVLRPEMFVSLREADDLDETGYESDVVFPLMSGTSVIGYALIELDQTARWNNVKKTILPVSLMAALFFGLAPMGCAVAFHRRSERLARLTEEAICDELTGLGSRRGLFEYEKELIGNGTAPPDGTAVIYLDIDKFKRLNDNYGHEHGDQLLKSIGSVIRTICEADKTLRAFRLGGDEFVLIGRDATDLTAIMELARSLEHVTSEDMSPNIGAPTCSIGVAIVSNDIKSSSLEQLITFADHALYVSKAKGGRATTLFDASMEHELLQQKYVGGLLDRSHETKPFILHYQPFFDLETSELSGFEALIRMRDLAGQLIPPDRFISIAERTGVIEEIGARCLIAACSEAKKWPPHLRVAVNISPVQFRSGNLLSYIRTALKLSSLDPSQLEVEVTESVLMENFEHVTAQLKEMQDIGIKIALDDFGTGFSSLSYLWRFSFDKVKIDRTFTQGIEQDESAFRILAAIIELANQIGFATTAEGIETVKQHTTLRELGCTFGQGYLLGRPTEGEATRLTILNALHEKMTRAAAAEPANDSALAASSREAVNA